MHWISSRIYLGLEGNNLGFKMVFKNLKARNRKGDSLVVNKTVIMILVVLALIILIFIMSRFGIVQKIKDLFPSFTKSNLTDDELKELGCDIKVAEIFLEGSFGFRKQYLIMEGTITGLIWDYDNGKIWCGNEILAGDIVKGVVKIKSYFLDENSQEFLKYKYNDNGGGGCLLASIEQMKLLEDSFKLEGENYLCKLESQNQDFQNEQNCIKELKNCPIFKGTCRDSPLSGEIELKNIECKGNQKCYVIENEEKLSDGDMKIEEFNLIGTETEKTTELLSAKALSLDSEILRFFSFKAKNNNYFCYSFRTEQEVLANSYVKKGENMKVTVGQLVPSLEKFVEFSAWNSKENKRVVKRIKLEIKGDKYHDGIKIYDDKNLKKKLSESEIGSIFYVSIGPLWFDSPRYKIRVENFKIEKASDTEILISGFYSLSGKFEEREWHEIDCNIWGWGVELSIEEIENSFKESLIKKCELN